MGRTPEKPVPLFPKGSPVEKVEEEIWGRTG